MVKSIKQLVKELSEELERIYETAEAKNIAMLLLEDKHKIDRLDLLSKSEVDFDDGLLQADLKRLLTKEPIQYVTGVTYFYGRKFQVRKGALIPRPETEELVDLIVRENRIDKPRTLDVGCGSGCITISLERELLGETVGIDLAEEALKVSRENAIALQSKATFQHFDILNGQADMSDLDILVSNPPYIPIAEKQLMHENVLSFEPSEALFVPDSYPLLFYEAIAKQGLLLLKAGGRLYFEIHENFGDELKMLIKGLGYRDIKVHLDMQGKDRMISAVR